MNAHPSLLAPADGLSRDPASVRATCLVGDVGGTNCRLALAQVRGDGVQVCAPRNYKCGDFADAGEGIDAYLQAIGWGDPVKAVVIAIAGPVMNGAVSSTNMPWRLSETDLREHVGAHAKIINDYTALSLSIEHLEPTDLHDIGGAPTAPNGETLGIVGAGTGFGAAALARGIGGGAAIATEGGHVAFAPVNDLEIEILRRLQRRFGRVSIERLLSGPGLVNLHSALAEIEGAKPAHVTPEDIVLGANVGDSLSLMTLSHFSAVYGSVAGDFALMFGARGGIYLGGGIAPAILGHLEKSSFRERFEDKGRFRDYLSAIPTAVIMNPYAALVGAAQLAHSLS